MVNTTGRLELVERRMGGERVEMRGNRFFRRLFLGRGREKWGGAAGEFEVKDRFLLQMYGWK